MAAVAAREGTRAQADDVLAAEWPFTIEIVPIGDLFADLAYQRPPQDAFIERIASQFDAALVGTLDVAIRPKGKYAILDGHQRTEIMRKVGLHGAWCAVYPPMTVKEEATFFYRKNKDRRGVHPFYSLRARAVAGDKTARGIFRIVEASDFRMSAGGKSRTIAGGSGHSVIVAIAALEDAYTWGSTVRPETLSITLHTIRQAFWRRDQATESEVIRGVARFWQPFYEEEVNKRILYDVLKVEGPLGYIGRAREKKGTTMRSYTQADIISREIVADYNRVIRSKGGTKLNANLLHKPLGGQALKRQREREAAAAQA